MLPAACGTLQRLPHMWSLPAILSETKVNTVQVEALAGCRVLHVACGVWHTAAVAAHVPGVESLQQQGSAEVDPAEWEAIQQKMADAYDALDEVRDLHSSPAGHLYER